MRLFKEGSDFNEETGHYEPHWTTVLDAQKGRTSQRRAQRHTTRSGWRSMVGGLRESVTSKKDRSLNGKARIKARRAARKTQ
jgi:hypothetical protein